MQCFFMMFARWASNSVWLRNWPSKRSFSSVDSSLSDFDGAAGAPLPMGIGYWPMLAWAICAGSDPIGGPVSGGFTIVIAIDGSVTGTYAGSVYGSITGKVETSGSYSAGSGGGDGVAWAGTMQKSGTTLTASGTWSSPPASGTWTGTSTVAN